MTRRLQIGVAGLGRAFTVMLPTFLGDTRVRLVAAADPRAEARQRFADDFAPQVHETVDALCADPAVEVIYVATPHQHHAAHVLAAARAGKHVLVEKPIALSLAECRSMIEAADAAKVQLIVGHSHSFDAPFRRTRELIESGHFGKVRMIAAQNYTDFLYRPRRPEELDTAAGGGVIFSQGAHQIDIVRYLAGGRVRSVRASTGIWDADRPTESAYAAQLTFEDGAFASAVYSGFAHFDSDELGGWIGEFGQQKDPAEYGAARRRLRGVADAAEEAALKSARNYGGAGYAPSPTPAALHQQFGHIVVSCDGADLRPLPNGVMIYADAERRLDPLPSPSVPRGEVIDELYAAVVLGRPPVHSGRWAAATLEVCLAILESSRHQTEIRLAHQVGLGG